MSKETRKRKVYSYEVKESIINDFNESDVKIKLSVKQIMEKYGITSTSTLYTIVNSKNQDKIKTIAVAQPECKRIKLLRYPEVDKAMEIWFNDVKHNKNIPIDGPIMQEQAIRFANLFGIKDFKASNGWLEKFKTRYSLTFKNIVGEAGVVDKDAAKNWMENNLLDIIKDYEPKNIFNADETSLFYKAVPNKTMHYKGLACNEVKVSKERLSLLLCTNMDGSEKLKPFLIGQFEKPRCFKGINISNLGVSYRWNKKAWMTNVLFNEWLAMLNKKYKLLNRKILLFVDNFSGHSCNQENFDYVRVQFFPPNLTSIIQPLDQGIINAFKMKYRKQIILDKLECLNTSTQMKNIEIIDGINFTVQAWSEISSSIIRNCFKKAGFKMEKFLGSCSSTAKEDLNEKKHMEDMWNKIRKTETGYDFSYFKYVEVNKE